MHIYATPEASRNAGVTYHLVPVPVWEHQSGNETYQPEHYEADGFIHCTNGTDKLVEVANMFYTADSRPFLVLALEVNKIASEIRYEDPDEYFPHIYGLLNTGAVICQLAVDRDADGTFTRIHAS